MRLNSEQDRVNKYKAIALEETQCYYYVLEQFTQLLDQMKEGDSGSPLHNLQRVEFKHI
jgi:hypothetical protein